MGVIVRIVIDKSALHAMSTDRFHALCRDHEVWMTEVLFYELVTTSGANRAALFRKIGAGEHRLRLTTNSGYLLGRELDRGSPVDMMRDSGLEGIQWVFNPCLQDSNWIPEDHMPDLVEWRGDTARRVDWFRERAAGVAHAFFPDLQDISPGELERVALAQKELGGDSARIRQIHQQLTAGLQTGADFGPNWLTYRALQAQLLWSLDHIARYGAGDFDAYSPRLENTYCDAEYATIACFADALLTRDNNLARLFGVMAPDICCGHDIFSEPLI